MLENIDLNRKMSRKEFNSRYSALCARLSELQRQQRAAKLPVLIVFEGVPAAGKGTQINKLIEPLDPRGFRVYAFNGQSEDEKRHPFFWRFWTLTPADGRIAIFDRSWYRSVMVDRFDGVTKPEQLPDFYRDINDFEAQLTFGGTLIIKFFLDITREEQKKRMKALLSSRETAWRVTDEDLERHKKYGAYQTIADEMLQETDTACAPWTIIESNDREYAACKIMSTVIERLEAAIPAFLDRIQKADAEKATIRAQNAQKYGSIDVEQMKRDVEHIGKTLPDSAASGTSESSAFPGPPEAASVENAPEAAGTAKKEDPAAEAADFTGEEHPAAEPAGRGLDAQHSEPEREPEDMPPVSLKSSILSSVDLTKSVSREDYRTELKKLQSRLSLLHSELYRRQIPVVIGFEGWDAGGKGGAIKRLTQALDPRGYAVFPTSAANDVERAHNYLWRFWNCMPKTGHIAIFDRTWYGRVMVERIEGFCTKGEWQHAYAEINSMEANLVHSGAIVLKFWMQIDKDEQARRFRERMDTPGKQWKITDEDWRNRAKWDAYETAVDEMLVRTSTTYAPWVIVEGNDKYYARLKVLRTVIDAIEKRLKQTES